MLIKKLNTTALGIKLLKVVVVVVLEDLAVVV
jgi:hypothetical protein